MARPATVEDSDRDAEVYARAWFQVRSKDKKIVPFVPLAVQSKYLDGRKGKSSGIRELCVKARQIGITTVNLAWTLHSTLTNPGTVTSLIGPDDKVVQEMLDTTRLMLAGIPESIRPKTKYDNRGELFFEELGSRFWIGTFRMARARGRTINNLILTEVAYWEDAQLENRMAGLTEAVPRGGNIIIESTPKGVGNWFHRECERAKAGDSAYSFVELPWYEHAEYQLPRSKWATMNVRMNPEARAWDKTELALLEKGLTQEQLAFRRDKMFEKGDWRVGVDGVYRSRVFAEEYECDFLHSGNSVFAPETLVPSCHWRDPIQGQMYVHGCDTAEGTEDGNFDVMETLCLDTGEFVAQIRGRWKVDVYAEKIHYQAMKYGGRVGVERNNTGHAVILRLVQLWNETAAAVGVEHMPYRIASDKDGKAGFLTTEISRKNGILDFEQALRTETVKLAFEDEVGIAEMRAWTYRNGKEAAPSGGHDDTILAKIIAEQMRKTARERIEAPKKVGRARLI